MALRVVGAGLARTGTTSLKLALERLLGAPCYHMLELFERPADVPQWEHAVRDGPADWNAVFDGYGAALDFPVSLFYDVLMDAYPDALVLLSTRRDPETWWQSMAATVIPAISRVTDDPPPLEKMLFDVISTRFTADWPDRDVCIAAYHRHNDAVRGRVPAERLIEWQPGDEWAPLSRALDLPEPSEPFPHVNTTAEFRVQTGLDQDGA